MQRGELSTCVLVNLITELGLKSRESVSKVAKVFRDFPENKPVAYRTFPPRKDFDASDFTSTCSQLIARPAFAPGS